MSTIQFDTDELTSLKEAANFFKDKKLKKGDEIKVLTNQRELIVLGVIILIAFALEYYFDKREKERKQFNDKMKQLLYNKSSEELEKEIEEEYGIDIEVEKKKEQQDDWHQFTEQGLANAYGEDEPDYSDVSVKERNLGYKGL